MAETAKKTWTYADLVREGLDPERYEIVDGERVEAKTVGVEGARIYARLGRILDEHVEKNRLGAVYAAARFLLREDPRLERRPDLAFVSVERLPPSDPDLYPGAPDLAVEIISPSDPSAAVFDKAREYLETGAREVWVVEPRAATIFVLRPGRPQDRRDRTQKGNSARFNSSSALM